MGEIVYVDLFFLINFSMDFLCLYLTAKLMSEKIRVGRHLLAAVFGGLYACVALFLAVRGMWGMLLDISSCGVMSFIAFFTRGRLRSVPTLAVVYTAVSMVLGGFMTALFNIFNKIKLSEIITGGEEAEDSISVWLLFLLALIGALFTKLCGGFFRGRSMRSFADVKIIFEGKSVTLRAMTDSGNLLREPISYKPCIVADKGRVVDIFPREIAEVIHKKSIADIGGIPSEYARRICFIPTRTATGEGILMGIRVDKITVQAGSVKNEKQVDAIVALGDIKKSAGGADALIPSELLI